MSMRSVAAILLLLFLAAPSFPDCNNYECRQTAERRAVLAALRSDRETISVGYVLPGILSMHARPWQRPSLLQL
jgi:hypothetical protein